MHETKAGPLPQDRLRVADGARTRDLHLGKVTLSQLSYNHIAMVAVPDSYRTCVLQGTCAASCRSGNEAIAAVATLPYWALYTTPPRADDRIRTGCHLLGRQVLDQMSFIRKNVDDETNGRFRTGDLRQRHPSRGIAPGALGL